MALYDYRLPAPALREFVRIYHILGCDFPASMAELPVKHYWPRAENCLTFFPRDIESVQYGFEGELIKSNRSNISGQFLMSTARHVGRSFMVFSVVFQPGCLYRLAGIPLHELTNRFVDAEAVFTNEIRRVNARLTSANHYTDMIGIVEAFLHHLVSKSKKQALPIDRIGKFLLDDPNDFSLDKLGHQAGLCQRQFYRQFAERSGISPKLFARIARFENAMKIKNASPEKDWLTIALELGYHDYQHLVRDFKEFTTLTPPAFYKESAKGPERAFGMVET